MNENLLVHGMDLISRAIEVVGVAVMVVGSLMATAAFLSRQGGTVSWPDAYRGYRAGLGRAILLGLEFLVAADIIGTVAITPTFASVEVLAAIVVIRTFLSFSLEVEVNGHWPWQRSRFEAEHRRSGGEQSSL